MGQGSVTSTLKEMAGTLVGSLARSAGLVLLVSLGSAVLASRSVPPVLSQPGDLPWICGLGIALLGFVVGGVVSLKRALLSMLERGAERARVGERAVTALFRHVLSVAPGQDGALAQAARRVPLAQAEELLRRAVQKVLSEEDSGGPIARRLHRLLMERVESLTLARFRAEGQDGVDLVKVRDELAQQADAALCGSLAAGRRKFTLAYALGLPLLAVLLPRLLPILLALRH